MKKAVMDEAPAKDDDVAGGGEDGCKAGRWRWPWNGDGEAAGEGGVRKT